MSTLGLIGSILVAVAVAVALAVALLVGGRRRRPAADDRPRTVADLVRIRAEEVLADGPPAATLAGVQETSTDIPESRDRPEAAGVAQDQQEAARPEDAEPATEVIRIGGVAVAPAAVMPAAAVPAGEVLELTGDDAPWRRAARMVAGGDGPVAGPAPAALAPAAVAPEQSASLAPVVADLGERDAWSGWTDRAEIDAEEDHRPAMSPHPVADLGFGLPGGTDAGNAVTTPRRDAAPADPDPLPVEPAAAGTDPGVDSHCADAGAVTDAVVLESDRATVVGSDALPAIGADATDAAGEPPDEAQPAGPGNGGPQGLAEAVPSPEPMTPPESERAAEQAAADLALLRTFGFADPGLRPDSAPVISLAGADDPRPDPEMPGAAQPVRFRALRRDGAPADGAIVTLLDGRGRAAGSGPAGLDGSGEVLAPHPGSYVLVATAPGHQPGAVALTVADGPVDADVLLVRSASLAGTVHGEDGPIAAARVTLVQDGEIVDAVHSDPSGGYRMADLGAGEYGLAVAAAGCEPIAELLRVPEETDVNHDIELDPAGSSAAVDRVGVLTEGPR